MSEVKGQVERIVVGLDGSASSGAALAWAVGLAGRLGAEVIAVHAVTPPAVQEYGYGFAVSLPVEVEQEWRAETRREFEKSWCRPLSEAGLRYRAVMADGRPATVLARIAEEVGADLVVVGRRGRGTVAEMLLGSVSHELSHHCHRPVLLVSAPAGQESARETTGASVEAP